MLLWIAALYAPTVAAFTAARPRTLRASHLAMNVMQAQEIAVGNNLPLLDFNMGIEVVSDECAFDDTCEVLEQQLNTGRTVLIGMPGAFTPTCTDEHLPGYIRAARKLRRAGVKHIAVVTTNDKFIMTAWKRKMRECAQAEGLSSIDGSISMIADKEGHLVKALGMVSYEQLDRTERNAFIQLNSGVRSKRFALVADDGVVTHVAVDDGTLKLDPVSYTHLTLPTTPYV